MTLASALVLLALGNSSSDPGPEGVVLSPVDSIIVTGAGAIDSGDLLEGTDLRAGVSLVEITPGEVEAAVLSNLASMGYLEASVDVLWPEWYEEEAVVSIEVHPGRMSLVGPMVFTGNTVIGAEELRRAVDLRGGSPLTPGGLDQIRYGVQDSYSRRGHALATVQVALLGFDPGTPDSLPGPRAVECVISEGPRLTLGTVTVEGLETVRKKVVVREMQLQPGDSLDMELMRRSIADIYRLGLFRDVRFVYEGMTEEDGVVDLLIRVTERPYRQLDLGAGYTSDPAILGSISWRHPNIMDNNQRLTVGGQWTRYLSGGGGDEVEPEMVYEEPYLFSTRWEGRLRLNYYYLQLPGLEERGYGAELSGTREMATDLDLTLRYALTRNRYWSSSESGGTTEYDWVTTSQVGAGSVHDTRDAVLDPRTGHVLSADATLSGGFLGGRSFYSLLCEVRVFKPIVRDAILAWRLRGGFIFPFGADSTIAPGDRFFLGGGSTIRGYGFNAVGPEDEDGNPTGDNVMILGNIEARMRILGAFGVALFLDTGGLWSAFSDISARTSAMGVGMGLRLATPFGPLRLDYGFAPTWTDGLRRGRAYIALGHAF